MSEFESTTSSRFSKKFKTRKSASEKAMDLLARRDHSEQELTAKLRRYEFTAEDIENAIEYVKEGGWLLPPEKMAEKVAERLHSKNKSALYIQQYLRSKGLPDVTIDRDLESEKAQRVIAHIPDRAKALRKLQQRGFHAEVIGAISRSDQWDSDTHSSALQNRDCETEF